MLKVAPMNLLFFGFLFTSGALATIAGRKDYGASLLMLMAAVTAVIVFALAPRSFDGTGIAAVIGLFLWVVTYKSHRTILMLFSAPIGFLCAEVVPYLTAMSMLLFSELVALILAQVIAATSAMVIGVALGARPGGAFGLLGYAHGVFLFSSGWPALVTAVCMAATCFLDRRFPFVATLLLLSCCAFVIFEVAL